MNKILFSISIAALLTSCNHDDNGPKPVTPNPNDIKNAITWNCSYTNITKDTVLKDVNADPSKVDYIVNCNLIVSGNATLTIEPGVVMQFVGASVGISTEGNAGLKAVGTNASKIVLTSNTATKGAWKGVFIGSNSVNNVLHNVLIQNGGGTKNSSSNIKEKAGLTVTNAQARLSVTNCTFSNCAGNGFWMGLTNTGNGSLDAFDGNYFENNELSGVGINAWYLDKLDATNLFGNNGNSYVSVYGIDNNAELYAISKNINVVSRLFPYRLVSQDIIMKDGAVLTFQPGAIIEFASGTGIRTLEASSTTGPDAAISAIGTPDQHITFRGIGSGQGAWKGIALLSANNQNQLSYCDISGGGAGTWIPIGNMEYGNVTLYSRFKNAKATITNCNITYSSTHGIAAKGSSNYPAIVNADIATANAFSNNAKQPDVYQ